MCASKQLREAAAQRIPLSRRRATATSNWFLTSNWRTLSEDRFCKQPVQFQRERSFKIAVRNYIVGENTVAFLTSIIVKRKSLQKSTAAVSTDLADERCPSGVEGLDDILAGGLPRAGFYLVQGDPGSGKTTLALQFLLEGLRRGEKVFYITLSETKPELLKVARSHGWSLDKIPVLDVSAVENLLRPEAQTTVFHPSEVELTKVSQLLLDETRKVNPARVVFDSLSEFRLMAETPLRYRRQLLNLKQEFAKYKSTVLLLDDKMSNGKIGNDPHVLSLTHGIIEMEQMTPDYGVSRRRLRVTKLRGVKFREGYHDYNIITGGLRIFPRLIAAEHHAKFRREH